MADNNSDEPKLIQSSNDDPFEAAMNTLLGNQEEQSTMPPPGPDAGSQPESEVTADDVNFDSDSKPLHTRNLDTLLELPVQISMEIGRAKMLISDLLLLGQGSVVELDTSIGDNLKILVGDKVIGDAEVVISNEKFAGRFKNIVTPEIRIRSIS